MSLVSALNLKNDDFFLQYLTTIMKAVSFLLNFVVAENIHIPTTEGTGNSVGVAGEAYYLCLENNPKKISVLIIG